VCIGPCDDDGSPSPRKRQTDLSSVFQMEKKLKLDRDLSKSIVYQGNISLGIFEENKHLKVTIQELAKEAGLPGYVPPNRYRMSKELLDHHSNGLSTKMKQRLLECPSSITASFDGWDSASRTHLLGVTAITASGAVFHSAIDCTDVELMGKEWTLMQIREIVAALGGPDVVIAVVLDSPNVNVGALTAYELEQPSIACLLCTCHVISLFLKDVFTKIEEIASTSAMVGQISKKFRNVKWLKERLAKRQTTMPLKVCCSRCCSHCLCLS
jgi:hypothetical protein